MLRIMILFVLSCSSIRQEVSTPNGAIIWYLVCEMKLARRREY